MTNPNHTMIAIILDRSGSMSAVKEATIAGFNRFLEDQKSLPGKATLRLVEFNDHINVVYDNLDIGKALPLTTQSYFPDGNTALLDAIGDTVRMVGKRLAELPEESRPGKVVVLVLTDGHENASHSYNAAQIREMIEHQRARYSWQFLFLGSEENAVTVARSYGVPVSNSMRYMASAAGMGNVMHAMNASVTSFRTGATSDASFTDADRDMNAPEQA